MKKLLSVVVVFVMVVAMSVTAFADAPTTTYSEENGNWTTSGENAAYANSMMTVVAISGDTINVNSIQYIDQTTADANGAYSFEGYLPKVDPAEGETYKVYVGGEKLAGPIEADEIYYIAPAGGNDVTLTGTVGKSGNITGATVALYNGENIVASATADATSGAFSITAPAGTYTLKITKPGHTKYIYNNVEIATLAPGATYTLSAGDANGDGYVGVSDVTDVIFYLEDPITAETKSYDVNDDDYIGVSDVTDVIYYLENVDTVLPAA